MGFIDYITSDEVRFETFLLIAVGIFLIAAIIYIIKLEKRNRTKDKIIEKQRKVNSSLEKNISELKKYNSEWKQYGFELKEYSQNLKKYYNNIINDLKRPDNINVQTVNKTVNEERISNEKKNITHTAKIKSIQYSPFETKEFLADLGNSNNQELEFNKYLNDYNLLCSSLYIFKMNRECWKCHKTTKVICLATDDADTLFTGKKSYERYKHLQLLSYVTAVPDSLAAYLKSEFRYFPSFSRTINQKYYINHCEYCKSVQGDNFLHEVPEEAFYKHLCYKNAEKSDYYKIENKNIIPIMAELPNYDLVVCSKEYNDVHIALGVENRASLHITQKLMDKLLGDSNYMGDIKLENI